MKKAIIFGGSSGIGRAVCEKIIGSYEVINASRTLLGNSAVKNVECDVTSADDVARAVAESGSVDLAVYCSGYSMAAPVEYADDCDYRYLFDVNYFGFLTVLKNVVPLMKIAGGGKIFVISSLGGCIPIAFDAFYSSSKAAVDMLVREINLELKPYNITVTSVLPGGTRTPFSFKRRIYLLAKESGYANLQRAVRSLYLTEQGGRAPERVADTLVACLKKRCPPIIVADGCTNKLFRLFSRILPDKILLAVCRMTYFRNIGKGI